MPWLRAAGRSGLWVVVDAGGRPMAGLVCTVVSCRSVGRVAVSLPRSVTVA